MRDGENGEGHAGHNKQCNTGQGWGLPIPWSPQRPAVTGKGDVTHRRGHLKVMAAVAGPGYLPGAGTTLATGTPPHHGTGGSRQVPSSSLVGSS